MDVLKKIMRETIVEELRIAYHSSTLLDGILVFYDPKENFYSKYAALNKNNKVFGGNDLKEVCKLASQ